MSAPISLPKYWDALKAFDWDYLYTESREVRQRGDARKDELAKMASQSPAHKALYDSFARNVGRQPPRPTQEEAS